MKSILNILGNILSSIAIIFLAYIWTGRSYIVTGILIIVYMYSILKDAFNGFEELKEPIYTRKKLLFPKCKRIKNFMIIDWYEGYQKFIKWEHARP